MRKLRCFLRGRLFPCALFILLIAAALAFLAVRLPRLLAPVALAERAFSLAVAVLVCAERDFPERKVSKAFLLAFLPWLGAALCLAFRPARPKKAEGPMRNGADAARSDRLLGIPCSPAESAEYLPDGTDFRARFLADLGGAKKTVSLEYYIMAGGAFFGEILRVLEGRAACGVRVRILYDDFGCGLTLPRDFPASAARRGIEARAFRPLGFPARGTSLRDHRKIAVVDGEICYTGGINLADEYVGETVRFGHWKDTAVRLTGAPALRFSALFESDWSGAPPPPPREGTGIIPCAVVADDADGSPVRAGMLTLCRLAASAERTLFLNTPYLAPDCALQSALAAAVRAGVDVRIMIPNVPDKRIVYLLTKSYARELERAGVKIRRYAAGFLHAKSACADGRLAFVSSYNLDFRSLYLQAECGALVDDGALGGALDGDFLGAWEAGLPLPRASLPERVFAAFLRLFAPWA